MTRDLLYALRWLRKNPLFTVAITTILALGIGANTAVFSVVDAVLLRPLPYASSDRLIRIEETSAKHANVGITPQEYLVLNSRGDLFEKTAPYLRDVVTLTGADAPDQITALRTSARLFSMLGVHARLGRPLVDSDDQPNSPNTVVLSDRLWRRLFHADPGVLGRVMTLSDEPVTIVGVMPPEFEFPSPDFDLWTQLRITSASTDWVGIVARMREGIALSQVQGALQIVARHFEQQEPQKKAGLQIVVSPWRETAGREYELTLVFILVAVGLVLLIACADVGSLLLSHAVQKQKEIAIRASLGAGLWRVVRQLLAESCVLAVLGSATGIAAAYYALQFLSKQMAALPIALPHIQSVALNGRVLIFNMVLCVLLACLFSLAPVFLASKTDLQAVMRSGPASGRAKGSTRLFALLIASEAAFAFLLLVGSGLMIRSLIRLQQADHGFHPEHVLTMRVPIGTRMQPRPSGKYDTKPRQMAFYHELIERLQRIPDVRAVAVVNNLPLSGFSTSIALPVLNSARTISPQYFAVMGIPLMAGRVFSEADQTGSPSVAIVNEYLAHQLFPNRDPIGQSLPAESSNAKGAMIVGVVKDASQNSYEQPAKAEVYLPYRQFIFGTFLSTIVVRTSGEPQSFATTLRKEVWAVEPNQPILKVETMTDVIADSIWRSRFSAWIFSVLGGLALLLTSAGIYGVVAYTTSLRVRELGIRVALGATPRKVVSVVMRDAMIPLAAGLAVSLVAALLLSRMLSSLLYEIGHTDPFTYLAAGALLLVIGAVATARPAWKAATDDPLMALRTE